MVTRTVIGHYIMSDNNHWHARVRIVSSAIKGRQCQQPEWMNILSTLLSRQKSRD